MCKHGLKIVLEGNTCIISKNGSFVGKGYFCDGMYKLSINNNDVKGHKCEICIQAKLTKKHFPKAEQNTQILDLIHTDICEYNDVLTRGGKRYFITFIDDCSRYTYVYLFRTIDETFDKFQNFQN